MYAQYTYTSGATIAQVHDDIFEIFCGETNVNLLSAGCDTANSFILTTYSTSPWVDFDDVSATERIMRMEMSDDTGVFKYVGWHTDTVDEVGFAIMESWDAGTDTPTNEVVVNFDKEGMGLFIGTGGVMHIYSSQFCTIVMHESTTNIWGQQRGDPTYGSLGIFECSRDHPSLTTGAGGMPNWFRSSTAMIWGDGDVTMSATFWKGRDNTNTVQTPLVAEMGYPGRDNPFSDTSSYAVTGALGGTTALSGIGADTSYGLEPIMVGGSPANTSYLNADTYIGNVSARCNIWFMPPGSEAAGSLVQIDSLPFIVFKTGHTAATAGTQYGGKLVVPYG